MQHPIMYSLRHCPYAMRARLGLLLASQTVELRAIILKDKPAEFLAVSPKKTVPVLVLENGSVINESLAIMQWALHQHDPQHLLYQDVPDSIPSMLALIARNDDEFVPILENYKSAKRYHDTSEAQKRQQCKSFILDLEQRLNSHPFFMGSTPSLADYALLPFIRQFARVNRKEFLQAPYPKLRHWLDSHLQSRLFAKAMTLYPLWNEKHEVCLLEN